MDNHVAIRKAITVPIKAAIDRTIIETEIKHLTKALDDDGTRARPLFDRANYHRTQLNEFAFHKARNAEALSPGENTLFYIGLEICHDLDCQAGHLQKQMDMNSARVEELQAELQKLNSEVKLIKANFQRATEDEIEWEVEVEDVKVGLESKEAKIKLEKKDDN